MLPEGKTERVLLLLAVASFTVLLADISGRTPATIQLLGNAQGNVGYRSSLTRERAARLQSLDEEYEWKGYKAPSNVFADNDYEVAKHAYAVLPRYALVDHGYLDLYFFFTTSMCADLSPNIYSWPVVADGCCAPCCAHAASRIVPVGLTPKISIRTECTCSNITVRLSASAYCSPFPKHILAYAQTHTHMCIYIHTYVHIHTHTCAHA
jgi:hypothetical protein